MALLLASGVEAQTAAASSPPTTISRYEPTTNPTVLMAQGVADGRSAVSGMTILDFGRPASAGGTPAMFDFGGNLDPLADVLSAAESYAAGFESTAPSRTHLLILIGTNDSCGSNQPCGYSMCGCRDEPASYSAWGSAWASIVDQFENYLRLKGWTNGPAMSAGGADDAEPGFDPGFTNTYDVIASYDQTTSLPMIDFGSLEGGPVDGFWTPAQMYMVAYGLRPDRPVPEIYQAGMAEQWAALAHWSSTHTSNPMNIVGLLTQSPEGYTPQQAYAALSQAFDETDQSARLRQFEWASNITYASQ